MIKIEYFIQKVQEHKALILSSLHFFFATVTTLRKTKTTFQSELNIIK